MIPFVRFSLARLTFLVMMGLAGLPFVSQAQLYPVQATPQLMPPYSVYLSDYATPGEEKLRLILLQRDLTQPAYQLRLVMQVELNGQVILRTTRSYNPPPISLNPGIPTIISGAELAPYLDSRNLDFVAYSREQYERTRALPEGSYQISFTAYDFRRPEVAVSNRGSSFYYLAKNEPPLINAPASGSRIPLRTPQQMIFSWLPRNTASPNSAADTQYELALFEIRPEGRNPNDLVLSTAPVFKTLLDFPQYVYSPADPLLLEGMTYAWRVRAIDRGGKDAFRNNGYSEVATFTYGGIDPDFDIGVVKGLQAQGETERRGRVWWSLGDYEGYRVHYRKTGKDYQWFTANVSSQSIREGGGAEGEVKLYDLEPDTQYEARVQAKKSGYLGGYSEVVHFRTPARRLVECGKTAETELPKEMGKPLLGAIKGSIVEADGIEVTLMEVQPLSEPGWYQGTGRINISLLGGAAFPVKFKRLYIREDRQVVAGGMDVVSQGVAALVEKQGIAQQNQQRIRDLGAQLADINPATAPLATLLEMAAALDSVGDSQIGATLVLKANEKEQLLQAKAQIEAAAQVLQVNPSDEAAQQKIRRGFADLKAPMQKLGEGIGKGLLVRLGLGELLDKIAQAVKARDKQALKAHLEQFDPELQSFFAANPQFTEPVRQSLQTELTQLKADAQLVYDNTDPSRDEAVWASLQTSAHQAQGLYQLYQKVMEIVAEWGLSPECYQQSLLRGSQDFLQRFSRRPTQLASNVILSALAAVFEAGRCLTERPATASYGQYVLLGFSNSLLLQLDIASLDVELEKLLADPKTWEAILEMFKTRYHCFKNLPASISQASKAPDGLPALEALLKPMVECNLGLKYERSRETAQLLYGYVSKNYSDGYLHGQVLGVLITLPWVTKQLPKLAAYLKADRLLALLSKNGQLAKDANLGKFFRAAERGEDDLARSLKQAHQEHPEQFAEFVDDADNLPGSGKSPLTPGIVSKKMEEIASLRIAEGLPPYSQSPGSTGTVAIADINQKRYKGFNSGVDEYHPKANGEVRYTLSDVERREWFDRLKAKGKLSDLKNLGAAQFLSHAEAETLIKAAKAGEKFPREITMFVDRPTCTNCKINLGALVGELGIEKLHIYYGLKDGSFTYVLITP